MADVITPETLDNLRALKARKRVPHPDAPINPAFAEIGTDFKVGEPVWVCTVPGLEVLDLADRVADIASTTLYLDSSADFGPALLAILELVAPALAKATADGEVPPGLGIVLDG